MMVGVQLPGVRVPVVLMLLAGLRAGVVPNMAERWCHARGELFPETVVMLGARGPRRSWCRTLQGSRKEESDCQKGLQRVDKGVKGLVRVGKCKGV